MGCNVRFFTVVQQLYLYDTANLQCYAANDNSVQRYFYDSANIRRCAANFYDSANIRRCTANDNSVRHYFYDSANIQRCAVNDNIVECQVYDRAYCFYDTTRLTNSDIHQVKCGTKHNDVPCTTDYKFCALALFNPFYHFKCLAWK